MKILNFSPRKHTITTITLLLILLLSLNLFFLIHHFTHQHTLKQIQFENQRLIQHNEAMNRELTSLKNHHLTLTESTQKQLKHNLTQLIEENWNLREEMTFYQQILATSHILTESAQEGIFIEKIKLKQLNNHTYHYRLILTQADIQASPTTGILKLEIIGYRASSEKNPEIITHTIPPFTYHLRYFQRLEGDFTLSPDFIPTHLIVTPLPTNAGSDVEEIKFQWKTLLKQED